MKGLGRKLEKRIPMPPEHMSDLELHSSNLFTREEVELQNKMIDWRNEQRRKARRRVSSHKREVK